MWHPVAAPAMTPAWPWWDHWFFALSSLLSSSQFCLSSLCPHSSVSLQFLYHLHAPFIGTGILSVLACFRRAMPNICIMAPKRVSLCLRHGLPPPPPQLPVSAVSDWWSSLASSLCRTHGTGLVVIDWSSQANSLVSFWMWCLGCPRWGYFSFWIILHSGIPSGSANCWTGVHLRVLLCLGPLAPDWWLSKGCSLPAPREY
jgi:hypothetical protein